MDTSPGRRQPPRRVLVVDDEECVVSVLRRQLERMGHVARVARSAEQALEALRAEPFDLVLLDVQLPGLTGFQAIDRISSVSSARIVLMSGHADEEYRADAVALGAAGMLRKPFELAELAKLFSDLP